MKSLNIFYKNKKVLVTGHTGFKGSWLTIWLDRLGAQVTGVALEPSTNPALFNLTRLGERVRHYRHDIRMGDGLQEIFLKEQPETVFHLAAQSLVIPGYNAPLATFATNTMGTANLLEACRKTKSVKEVVIITTDKVYKNREQLAGYREDEPLGGDDPYSASKAAAEIIAGSYRHSFTRPAGVALATVRAGNVIGGGDWAPYRLVPDCIRSLEKGDPVIIRKPEAVRPWQHVLEPLSGYILLAEKMGVDPVRYSTAWNFGPEEESVVTVRELADTLISRWGTGKWRGSGENSHYHEAGLLSLNIEKVKEKLNWSPLLNFHETVNWTVDWYRKYNENNAYQLCADQIENYTEKWNSKS